MIMPGDLIKIQLDQVNTCSPLAIQEFRPIRHRGSEGDLFGLRVLLVWQGTLRYSGGASKVHDFPSSVDGEGSDV